MPQSVASVFFSTSLALSGFGMLAALTLALVAVMLGFSFLLRFMLQPTREETEYFPILNPAELGKQIGFGMPIDPPERTARWWKKAVIVEGIAMAWGAAYGVASWYAGMGFPVARGASCALGIIAAHIVILAAGEYARALAKRWFRPTGKTASSEDQSDLRP